MTDKEFKRLSRSQLIEIIYQLQLKQDELVAENEALTKALEDRRLRINKAGNIAEAALEVHNVMQAAQDAAAHYLEEMQLCADHEHQRILKEANDRSASIIEKAQQEAAAIIEKARQEAAEIVAQAQKERPNFEYAVEVILREFGDDQQGSGEKA